MKPLVQNMFTVMFIQPAGQLFIMWSISNQLGTVHYNWTTFSEHLCIFSFHQRGSWKRSQFLFWYGRRFTPYLRGFLILKYWGARAGSISFKEESVHNMTPLYCLEKNRLRKKWFWVVVSPTVRSCCENGQPCLLLWVKPVCWVSRESLAHCGSDV